MRAAMTTTAHGLCILICQFAVIVAITEAALNNRHLHE